MRPFASALGLRCRAKLLLRDAGRVGSVHPCGLDESFSPGNSQSWQPRLLPVLIQSLCGPRAASYGGRVDDCGRLLRACIRPHDGGLVVSSSPPLLAHRILLNPRRSVHGLARSIEAPSRPSEGGGSCPKPRPNPSHSAPSLLAHPHAAAGSSFSDCPDCGTFCHPYALASGVLNRRVECTEARGVYRKVDEDGMAWSHAMA